MEEVGPRLRGFEVSVVASARNDDMSGGGPSSDELALLIS